MSNICSFDLGYKNFSFYLDSKKFTYFDCIFIANDYKTYDIKMFYNKLSQYYMLFKKCDVFLIESQRFNNIKIFLHLESYLTIYFPTSEIIIINPYKKNLFLNIKGTYIERKKKAINFCENNMTEKELKKLSLFKKKDDIADSYCQYFFFKKFFKK